MGFEIEMSRDVAVVQLDQETLVASHLDDLKDELGPVLENHARVVLDMSQVRFIDSTVCGLFVSWLKQQQKNGGDLKICCTRPEVGNLFSLMGFDKLFGVVQSREDAVRGFRRKPAFTNLVSRRGKRGQA